LVISQACRSVDGIGVVSAWELLLQFGALLDGKRSGLFCCSQQSWSKQAEDLILQNVAVCQQITFYHHYVQKIQLLCFLLHEICVQFEKEKKFLLTE
jgi:hypothetical protein